MGNMPVKSDTTDRPSSSDAPYVFKRYLDGGGGAVYEVRQHGRALSIHPDFRSAQKAISPEGPPPRD